MDENGVVQKDLVNLPENQSVKVIIEDGVKEIGNRAFEGCKGLASVALPASVTLIGDSAFSGCTNLALVKFAGEKSKVEISELAFPDGVKFESACCSAKKTDGK